MFFKYHVQIEIIAYEFNFLVRNIFSRNISNLVFCSVHSTHSPNPTPRNMITDWESEAKKSLSEQILHVTFHFAIINNVNC